MAMLPLMHLAQVSMATNHRTHLASWAPISCAWYPDATAAHLTQGIFLLMILSQKLITFMFLVLIYFSFYFRNYRETWLLGIV